MRTLLALGFMTALAGCANTSSAPPVVSWQYGTGNGDGVAYGPAPKYARAYGAGSGDGVQSGQTATTAYSYGAENQSGNMVQFAPKAPTVVAAPASATPTAAHL